MRSEIKGRVTPISVDTVPPRILPEKQQNISQLWFVQATEIASLNTRGASWSVERNCTLMNEQGACRIWVEIWKFVVRGYDKATARQLKVSLIISSVRWKICMYKAYWFYFTLIWRSLWNPTVRKLSWHFIVLGNMQVFDKSVERV